MKEPESYWQTKEQEHRSQARAVGKSLIGFAIGGPIGLIALYIWLVQSKIASADRPWQLIPAAVPVLLAAISVFWYARILVRLFLSHIHLQTDAAERLVMVRTYRILLSGGYKLSPTDLEIILRQLFRRAATGVVKDDAAPAMPIEVLTRAESLGQ